MAERRNTNSTEIDKIKSTNKALIVTLIVASFFLGFLTNKVATLEKGSSPTVAPVGNTQQPAAAAPATEIAPVTDNDHIRGNKNAKITLVEYSDLECPFCKTFHPTMQQAMDTYGDQVRWLYRHYPLSFHANAQKEAEASECVADLGGDDKFWEFIDRIFERTTGNGTGFALTALGPLAEEIGVNQAQFQSCLDIGKYAAKVTENLSKHQFGTPATFIIDSKGNTSENLGGAIPFAQLKQAIDTALK